MRGELRIPVFNSRRPAWTAAQDALLGQQSDEDIARRLNRTGLSVASRRFKLHIPKPHSKRPPWTPQQERWLGKLSDVEIARRTGHTLQGIGFRRRRLGLSDPTRRPALDTER